VAPGRAPVAIEPRPAFEKREERLPRRKEGINDAVLNDAVRLLDRIAESSLAARLALASVCVGLAGAAAALYGADVAQASLFLLLAVVVGALGGRRVGIFTAILGAVVLNFAFTPPRWTLRVGNGDDAVALIVFAAVALATGTLVAAAADSRRVAERRARTAELALDLTSRLRAGDEPAEVARAVASRLCALFGFTSARLAAGGVDVTVGAPFPPDTAPLLVAAPLASLEAVPSADHELSDDDGAVLESLVANLSAALEALTLEREAEAARVAAEVSRTRAGLLSAVSHNLRTPLAAVHAATGTLLAPEAVLDDSERRELLETVRDETARLERLVAKVLDLGRIRAGGLELAPEPVDLAGLLQASVHRLKPLLDGRPVGVEIADDLDEVTLDPVALEQVMSNLLENAVRYAPDGTPIEIIARRLRGQLELRVVDHGAGVPPDERDKVFDEFYRVDRRADSDGTGLGLAIVKAIVLAQGGRVWVEDTSGGGATFVVRLPRVMES
jgi:two-component system sensor histidine kinase KdpD